MTTDQPTAHDHRCQVCGELTDTLFCSDHTPGNL